MVVEKRGAIVCASLRVRTKLQKAADGEDTRRTGQAGQQPPSGEAERGSIEDAELETMS